MRTFKNAPITAERAQSAATPASEADALMPMSAMARATSMDCSETSITRKGVSIANKVAACTASSLAAFSESDLSGKRQAIMMRSKASVSRSMRATNSW